MARALDDPRDARYTDHSYKEMLSQRIFQIACGYEDANDGNTLRHDPAFKAACGRLPISDDPLARIIHKPAVSSCKPLFYNGHVRNTYCNQKGNRHDPRYANRAALCKTPR
ncbi:MAG TPA: transposase, partial [Candidatus Nitrosocosmicus sp.]|nr:transposase [Candidatus Nitrosocosmicus sp.]